jgi:hypothetical protein
MPLRSWKIPFQNAAMVLFQHCSSGQQELAWIKTEPMREPTENNLQQDLPLWVLNHIVMLDNRDDFVIPELAVVVIV